MAAVQAVSEGGGVMAVEYVAQTQVVEPGANIVFAFSIPEYGAKGIRRRAGSGIVSLQGNPCGAAHIVRFTGNVAIPAGGTAGEISAAITLDGEILPASEMIVTPAAAEDLWNVSAQALFTSGCCCASVAVRNTSDQPITVQSGNLIVE
jgi:hypothetical protein